MADPYVTIGLTALGMVATFGLFEIYDAYKYRDHPTESVRREVTHWGALTLVWAAAVAVVAFT